jgi:hypothetical protein
MAEEGGSIWCLIGSIEVSLKTCVREVLVAFDVRSGATRDFSVITYGMS